MKFKIHPHPRSICFSVDSIFSLKNESYDVWQRCLINFTSKRHALDYCRQRQNEETALEKFLEENNETIELDLG